MLDCVEDLNIINCITALITFGATTNKTTSFFPATEGFFGELEFFGGFGDRVGSIVKVGHDLEMSMFIYSYLQSKHCS